MLIYEMLNGTYLYYINYNVIKYMCICIFIFQIIIMQHLKNDYKLKNVLLCKSFCLILNKTIPKTSNISLLNQMVSKTSNISLLNKIVFLL
jgi:hypothetical protein